MTTTDPDRAYERSVELLVARYGGATGEEAILRAAEGVLEKARRCGFLGPPFDPEILASTNDISVHDIAGPLGAEAIIFSDTNRQYHIAYDPSRPETRRNFSIAHEMGHALFPDCGQAPRCRGSADGLSTAARRIESLCNLAAAEFLMPLPEFYADVMLFGGGSGAIVPISAHYRVSLEAVAIRIAHVELDPLAVVVLELQNKLHEPDDAPKRLRVSYAARNQAFRSRFPEAFIPEFKSAPDDSVAYQAFTSGEVGGIDSGVERWGLRGMSKSLIVDAMCLPAPFGTDHRVLVLLRPL